MTVESETMTEIQVKGLVDAADRILRELIRTPKFKEGVMILLNSIDPPAARRLIRTFMWGDPGLLMSIMGSLPEMINTASEALAELAAQMNSMPPLLLQDFLNRVFAGIDGAVAGEAAGGLVNMALSLNLSDKEGGLAQSLSRLGADFGRAYAETAGLAALTGRLDAWMAGAAEKAQDPDSGVHAFIQAAGKAIQNNPAFTENVLRPLLGPVLEAPAAKGVTPAKKPTAKKPVAKPKPGEEA
jgi:hypothetical protein